MTFARIEPLDPELMATDHFYFADHAEEFEQIEWDRASELIAATIYRQEESRHA